MLLSVRSRLLISAGTRSATRWCLVPVKAASLAI